MPLFNRTAHGISAIKYFQHEIEFLLRGNGLSFASAAYYLDIESIASFLSYTLAVEDENMAFFCIKELSDD